MYQKMLPAALAALFLAGCPGAGIAPTQPAQPTLQATKQIPVGKSPHGMGATAGFIYNADTGDSRVSVIDAASDAVVATIPFPEGKPGYVKAFHDGKHMLITDTVKGELLVVDPAQGHKVLQRIAVGKGPDKIRVGDDDRRVLVSLTNEANVVVLTFDADRSKAPVRKDFAVGSVAGGTFKHRDAAFAGDWIVCPNSGDNNVSLINLVTGEAKLVTAGNNPGPVAIGLAGAAPVAALVGNAASNTITLFELPGATPTTLSDVGLAPSDIAVDPQLGRAFVSMSGSNELTAVDYVGKKVIGKVPVGKRPVHVYLAPQSHEVWVGNDDGESVTVVDGETLRVKATVATGKGHHKMAFWGTKAYVSNITDNTVSVVDRAAIE